MPTLPARVRVTEVGPRDGLQNEAKPVPTDVKVAFVHALVAAGVTDVEVSSFVRPDAVPQLADAEEVFARLGSAPPGVTYGALVPNERGLERALAAKVGKVAVFTAATETFNRRNVNATIAESIARFRPVVDGAARARVPVRGYVSTAFWCPYEGRTPPSRTADVCARLLELGCDEIDVGDTIGAATPPDVAAVLDAVLARVPVGKVVLHFHDTRGTALANVLEGLRRGVVAFDASAGGLGGCPYAPGASGNLATEDLVYLLSGLGIEHGTDLEGLRAAGRLVEGAIGRPLPGKVFRAGPAPLGPPALR
jgi:isopropylmalate/homocitrate/citramalate synthase